MRKFLIITLAALAAVTGSNLRAQSLEAFKQQLASSVQGSNARISVREIEDAAQAVAQASHNKARLRFQGYRVCIFFDNRPDARAGAVAARSLFESTFPGESVYMVYENPYFKVSVGNCLTIEEAIILKGRVSETFPKAFPKQEELSLSDLLNEEKSLF